VSKSTTSKAKSKSNIGSIFADGSGKSKSKSKAKSKSAPKPRAKKSNTTPATSSRAGVREQEPESDEDDEEDEQSLLDDEADAEDDEDSDDAEKEREEREDTSDADMMLAEITHSPPPDSSAPSIPIPLLHRLLHHFFHNPDTTKLSTDARACVGKYIETFVREGIARCAFEVGEKAGERSDSGLVVEDVGWLEVEDLERVGGQLVLDF
jgi:hypothetical protein